MKIENSSHFTLKSNFLVSKKIKSHAQNTYERNIINSIKVIASAVLRGKMNELYQKIINYVYEIRTIEIDEYLYGLNRKKINMEKAYDIISDVPNSESNAIINFWKGRFTDPGFVRFKSSRVEENETRAILFYRKAVELDIEGMAEAGDKYAQVCLGGMYECGDGVDRNCSRALNWYRKAAEQGYALAQYNLGFLYEVGYGVDLNYITAVEWYRKAAEQGHADAQNNLGWMYESGAGIDENDSTAVEWYCKAAEQGYAHAERNLDRLMSRTKNIRKRARLC